MLIEQRREVDVDELVPVHREDLVALRARRGCEPDRATTAEALGLAGADDLDPEAG